MNKAGKAVLFLVGLFLISGCSLQQAKVSMFSGTPVISATATANGTKQSAILTKTPTAYVCPTCTCPIEEAEIPDLKYYCLEEHKNYILYDNKSHVFTSYYIYDNRGNFLDMGFNRGRGVNIKIFGQYMQVLQGYGTYAFDVKYFDLENGLISRFYEQPLACNGQKVVYFTKENEQIVLVIESIFDRSYKKRSGVIFPIWFLTGKALLYL